MDLGAGSGYDGTPTQVVHCAACEIAQEAHLPVVLGSLHGPPFTPPNPRPTPDPGLRQSLIPDPSQELLGYFLVNGWIEVESPKNL